MTYKKPELEPDEFRAWNGDVRKISTRWNGDADMEDVGFHSRGVHTTEGTRPPSGLKPANPPRCPSPTSKAALSPVDRPYRPAMRVSEVENPMPCEVITLIKHSKGKRK